MNWTIIGLLLTFILVLLCLLAVAIYTIRRLHKHSRRIEKYLDQYKVLSTKCVSYLTRINEIVEEFDPLHWSDSDVMELISNIRSLVKPVGK